MKLSLYTSVRDGLYYDYHVEKMIRHHLPLADEIIVHDGNSSDGTLRAISGISDKVKIYQSDWGKANGFEWITNFKNYARERAVGDWCINIDCDEFIPEWEFEPLRRYLMDSTCDVVSLRQINFYGNFKVYHSDPVKVPWPELKLNIHRNLDKIRVVGDGSNVGTSLPGDELSFDMNAPFECHHFGFVRNPARLRQKWRNVLGNLYLKQFGGRIKFYNLPDKVFDLFPHDWFDDQFLSDLRVYEGRIIKAVLDDPSEFTRDNFKLLKYLQEVNA